MKVGLEEALYDNLFSFVLLKRFQEWLGSNSELTPSETAETFEDDESEVRRLVLCLLRVSIHRCVTCSPSSRDENVQRTRKTLFRFMRRFCAEHGVYPSMLEHKGDLKLSMHC